MMQPVREAIQSKRRPLRAVLFQDQRLFAAYRFLWATDLSVHANRRTIGRGFDNKTDGLFGDSSLRKHLSPQLKR